MASLKNSALPRILSEVVADLADLFQKEIRLARAELSEKLSLKMQAGVWIAVAGCFALLALLILLQAAIFGITAAFNIDLHWSCTIVGVALAAIAAVAFLKARASNNEELYPARTVRQVKEDIATVREQLG